MNNTANKIRESTYQGMYRILNFLFVEGLRETRDNAEVWQEWTELREGMANSIFATAALLPMALVTYLIGETYLKEMKGFPDLIRVILAEAVICWGVIMYSLVNFIRCAIFKGWLVKKGLL